MTRLLVCARRARAILTKSPRLVFGDSQQIELVKVVEQAEELGARLAELADDPRILGECEACKGQGQEECTTCDGSGECPHCDAECPKCAGDGTAECERCQGTGSLAKLTPRAIDDMDPGEVRELLERVREMTRAAA